nr:UbiX family flavin prenyltransferase [Rhodoblastus acidophilus]
MAAGDGGVQARRRQVNPRVVVGLSGASGAAIGLRIVEILDERGADVHVVVSRAAELTLREEVGPDALSRLRERASKVHDIDSIGATIASGSFPTRGMIVAPCSMRTLASIANCLADNLLTRAADVHLKERRPLILLARETPLHLGHLRAMTAATEAGAIIMPPAPAFYLKPQSVADIIDQIARRAVDLLRLFEPTAAQWRGEV